MGAKIPVSCNIDGDLQTDSFSLPAIVTVDLLFSVQRYVPLNIMIAKKKPLDVRPPEALGDSKSSNNKTLGTEAPTARSPGIGVKSTLEPIQKPTNEAMVI